MEGVAPAIRKVGARSPALHLSEKTVFYSHDENTIERERAVLELKDKLNIIQRRKFNLI